MAEIGLVCWSFGERCSQVDRIGYQLQLDLIQDIPQYISPVLGFGNYEIYRHFPMPWTFRQVMRDQIATSIKLLRIGVIVLSSQSLE